MTLMVVCVNLASHALDDVCPGARSMVHARAVELPEKCLIGKLSCRCGQHWQVTENPVSRELGVSAERRS